MVDRILNGYGVFFDLATGRAISEGTRFPEKDPPGVALYEQPEPRDFVGTRWDEQARALVPFTNDDRIAAIDNDIARLQVERAKLQGGG